MAETLYIKNMVCARCIAAVDGVLRRCGLHPASVELGRAVTDETLSPEQRRQVGAQLEALGFELIEDREQRVISEIKTAVIEFIHYAPRQVGAQARTLSEFITARCHRDYSALSRLFSEATGESIERYAIRQRIEKVKELLVYDELTVSEIAYRLGYSSSAHLSAQFKAQTGLTPLQFRRMGGNRRKALDQV
jgi:AraC-like DNA-binding protein